jgi:signal transduction histidine kinase
MRGIPVLLRLVRLDAASPAPVVLVQVTDLRERRKSEELVRSNRWRALDRQQMLDLSARLRNVLSALSQAVGAIDRVRTGGDVVLSSTHAAMLRGSLAQSELLLDGLQALATEQEHAAALVELRALVSTQLALFRQMLPPQVQLTWAVGESDVMVRGSETQLQQVLTALVMNAWDAQRSGGAIHVSVQYTDDVVVVAVEDEGPGVPEEQADWIFLPMTSTRSAEGASGLGLSTARRAAEMHGGQLRLDRTRTAGARFELILPRYRSRAPEVRPQPRATPLVRSDAGI